MLGGLLVSMVFALITWFGSSGGSPIDALRLGVTGWVYVHGASLSIGGASVTIVPWGGTLLVVWLLAWSVSRVREDGDDTWPAWGLATIIVYTVAVAAVAIVVAAGDVGINDAVVTTFVIAILATAVGLRDSWWTEIPDRVRTGVAAGAHAFGVILGAGVLLVAVSLFLQRDRFVEIWQSLDPGWVGGLTLAVFCVAWLPNLVAWAVAVMLGPGFALGVGTSVDLWGSQLGQIPAIPVLAAIPEAGSFPGWVFGLAVVPVVAGMAAGWRVVEDVESEVMTDVILEGVIAAAAAGLVVALLVAASGGSIGPGLMQQSGPTLWPTIVLAPVLFGFGGGLGAAAGHLRTAVATD